MLSQKRKRIVVLNNVYLVDCYYITICPLVDRPSITYSHLKSTERFSYRLKASSIDCWGLEQGLKKVINHFCMANDFSKEDIVVNAPIPIDGYEYSAGHDAGRVINNYLVNGYLDALCRKDPVLASYGPFISEGHLKRLEEYSVLPSYYVESVCFQLFRFRNKSPKWYLDFVRKLENERFN
jgi:hypothetical protein